MKSGQHRDIIASWENVISFEIESVGALDYLLCVIIKGVCDYANSHKSDNWHTYAAVTAAAVLNALLQARSGSSPPTRHVSFSIVGDTCTESLDSKMVANEDVTVCNR